MVLYNGWMFTVLYVCGVSLALVTVDCFSLIRSIYTLAGGSVTSVVIFFLIGSSKGTSVEIVWRTIGIILMHNYYVRSSIVNVTWITFFDFLFWRFVWSSWVTLNPEFFNFSMFLSRFSFTYSSYSLSCVSFSGVLSAVLFSLPPFFQYSSHSLPMAWSFLQHPLAGRMMLVQLSHS
jgi:hypothetical protein